jgi:hypothetical protein
MSTGNDIILDDTGRVWQTGSTALLQSLHVGRRDYDLTQYLIRNLGFVRFRTFRSDVRITLRPRFLTKAAYESLVHVMVTQERERTVIEIVDTPNRVEIIPGLEDAAARLADLATIGGNIAREDFHREALSFHRLRQDPRLSPLSAMMRRWRCSGGNIQTDFATTFGDPDLRGRAMVIRMVGDGRGIVEYAGHGFTCFDPAWCRSVLGHDMSEQPDPQYGENIAAAYSETHFAQKPRLEFVEAVIRVPGCSARRSRYERLLLPWRRGSAMFVSTVSVLRTSFSTAAPT